MIDHRLYVLRKKGKKKHIIIDGTEFYATKRNAKRMRNYLNKDLPEHKQYEVRRSQYHPKGAS